MPSLTPQREKFAQAVASGMNQSDAYRKAFKVRPGTKPLSVNQAASKLMKDANISSRVDQLRAPIAKKAQITLESHLEDLQRLRNMAVKAEQFGAAITAEVARGKAAGIVVEKGQINLTNSDGSLRPTVITIRARK